MTQTARSFTSQYDVWLTSFAYPTTALMARKNSAKIKWVNVKDMEEIHSAQFSQVALGDEVDL